jgi:predicted Rossmann-fold nucleotide-binding protein
MGLLDFFNKNKQNDDNNQQQNASNDPAQASVPPQQGSAPVSLNATPDNTLAGSGQPGAAPVMPPNNQPQQGGGVDPNDAVMKPVDPNQVGQAQDFQTNPSVAPAPQTQSNQNLPEDIDPNSALGQALSQQQNTDVNPAPVPGNQQQNNIPSQPAVPGVTFSDQTQPQNQASPEDMQNNMSPQQPVSDMDLGDLTNQTTGQNISANPQQQPAADTTQPVQQQMNETQTEQSSSTQSNSNDQTGSQTDTTQQASSGVDSITFADPTVQSGDPQANSDTTVQPAQDEQQQQKTPAGGVEMPTFDLSKIKFDPSKAPAAQAAKTTSVGDGENQKTESETPEIQDLQDTIEFDNPNLASDKDQDNTQTNAGFTTNAFSTQQDAQEQESEETQKKDLTSINNTPAFLRKKNGGSKSSKKSFKIFDKVALMGLSVDSIEPQMDNDVYITVRDLVKHGVKVVFDSKQALGKSVIKALTETQGKGMGVYLQPFMSEKFKNTDNSIEPSNVVSFIYSNFLERLEFMIKESRAFVFFDIDNIFNLTQFVNLLNIAHLYHEQNKPLILFGQGWNQKLTQLQQSFDINEAVTEQVTVVTNTQELISKLQEIDSKKGRDMDVSIEKVVDRRIAGDEKDFVISK